MNEKFNTLPPIRLAVVFDQLLNVGGGYQQALNATTLVKNIKKEYCIPVFFTLYPENINILTKYGIEVNLIKISKLGRLVLKVRGAIDSKHILKFIYKLIGLNRFEKILVEHKADLVYFTSPSSWCNYLERLNYIITLWDLCHRDYPEFPEVHWDRTFEEREKAYTRGLTKSVAVLVDSDFGKSNVVRRYGVDENRVHVMPFSQAIHIQKHADQYVDNKLNIKEKYNISGGYIFYPAQFWAHKNHVYVLQGLRVLDQQYGVHLNVIFSGGDGGNLNYIKKIADELGVLSQVSFVGFVDDVELLYLYKEAVALVMPTYFGPTNIPPLEAFSLGVPVLYSDLPGLREQVKDAALLMDLDNPDSMARHIYNLINDSNLVSFLVDNGKKKSKLYGDDLRINIIQDICRDFQIKRYCWE